MSLLAPVHPELDVRLGAYEVTTIAPSDVTVLIKSGEVDAEAPQFIDLNLWRVSQGVAAATLEQEVRAAVDRVLQNQDLSVGSVKVVDADSEDGQQLAEIQDDQAPDVCAAMTEAVGENRSLDLAILETATTTDGETLLGFSVGLPGSSPAPGVKQTCTLAVTSDTPIDLLASTLVHEGSHFMGSTTRSRGTGRSSTTSPSLRSALPARTRTGTACSESSSAARRVAPTTTCSGSPRGASLRPTCRRTRPGHFAAPTEE